MKQENKSFPSCRTLGAKVLANSADTIEENEEKYA